MTKPDPAAEVKHTAECSLVRDAMSLCCTCGNLKQYRGPLTAPTAPPAQPEAKGYVCVTCGKTFDESGWSPRYCSHACDPDPWSASEQPEATGAAPERPNRLTPGAYAKLVEEDIAWLVKQPRSLEKDHILVLLRHSEVAMYHAEEAVGLLRALVESLPRCCNHPDRTATRAFERGGYRYCDECGRAGSSERAYMIRQDEEVPDYPRAQPVRDAIAWLRAHDEGRNVGP